MNQHIIYYLLRFNYKAPNQNCGWVLKKYHDFHLPVKQTNKKISFHGVSITALNKLLTTKQS